MREILFRGKRKDNGEWVYGNYAVTDNNEKQHFIFQNKAFEFEVVPKTVCQYTGLKDKNDNKIYEGDIVKREYTLWHSETKKTRETQIGVVSYSNKECGFCLDKVCYLGEPWDGDTLEIIGNIHDNPN